MPTTPTEPHPQNTRALSDEADIGSGEKTPGQRETEQMIRKIPPLPPQEKGGQHAAEAGAPDKAAHGEVQREQGASRQEADPGMTPDAAI